MQRLLAAATAALTLSSAGLAHAWEPSAINLGQVKAGRAWAEVAADGPGATGVIHGMVEIDARPEKVWKVMNDCVMARRMIAGLIVCRIVQTGPGGAWDVREQVTKGNVFMPDLHNTYHNDYTPFSLIRFRRVGGDMKVLHGEWRLVPLDGGARTRVVYENHVEANFAGPAGLVREALRRDTPKVLANLKRECEGG
jgi:hypothetical protein